MKGLVLRVDDTRYQGEFRERKYWGQGELTFADGDSYRGQFVRGQYDGKGRFLARDGSNFEGEFRAGDLVGGTVSRKNGARYKGGFLKWRYHGKGKFTDPGGGVYEGNFVDGELEGQGRFTDKRRGRYEGEFHQWGYHGRGVLTLPNGDVYKGQFAGGVYEGEGTLTYAAPRPDGRKQDSDKWRFGMLINEAEAKQAQEHAEAALYNQRRLLDGALAALARRDPGKINIYMLAVAGDGSQEVFRREVEFVRDQFAARFGMKGYSLALINSRNTLTSAPMATQTSVREALKTIAARMDREQDILFFFLTSHGSRDHVFSINQNNMNLRGLPAKELGAMLKESGIRWKVVVVSACYSGGFIDAIKDDTTLVITAARHDWQSFGCADENDFTYFGHAFFKEALPRAISFEDAFGKASTLVREWEDKDTLEARNAMDASDKARAKDQNYSLPQMHNPDSITRHLRQWWRQQPAAK